jgi:hypothetical protein
MNIVRIRTREKRKKHEEQARALAYRAARIHLIRQALIDRREHRFGPRYTLSGTRWQEHADVPFMKRLNATYSQGGGFVEDELYLASKKHWVAAGKKPGTWLRMSDDEYGNARERRTTHSRTR